MRKAMTKKGTSYLSLNAQNSIHTQQHKSSVNHNDPLFDSMASQHLKDGDQSAREMKEFVAPSPK